MHISSKAYQNSLGKLKYFLTPLHFLSEKLKQMENLEFL